MTAPAPWWTATDGDGFVPPRTTNNDRVTEVVHVSEDMHCVRLTDIARADLGVGWDCIDARNSTDAQRISELIARLVAALRELGDA